MFQITKESGFDGIDLHLQENAYDLWDKKYLKELIEKVKIPIISLSITPQKMDNEKLEKIIEIAKYIGVEIINFFPPHRGEKDVSWFKKGLKEAQEKNNILISVQNVPLKFIFFIIPEYKNTTLDQIKSITWNASLDIENISLSSGMDIQKATKILGSALKNIYLNDKNDEKKWLIPWSANGSMSYLPLESFLMQLKTNEYKWFFSLKVSPKELGVWDEKIVLEKLGKLKEYYEKYFLYFKA